MTFLFRYITNLIWFKTSKGDFQDSKPIYSESEKQFTLRVDPTEQTEEEEEEEESTISTSGASTNLNCISNLTNPDFDNYENFLDWSIFTYDSARYNEIEKNVNICKEYEDEKINIIEFVSKIVLREYMPLNIIFHVIEILNKSVGKMKQKYSLWEIVYGSMIIAFKFEKCDSFDFYYLRQLFSSKIKTGNLTHFKEIEKDIFRSIDYIVDSFSEMNIVQEILLLIQRDYTPLTDYEQIFECAQYISILNLISQSLNSIPKIHRTVATLLVLFKKYDHNIFEFIKNKCQYAYDKEIEDIQKHIEEMEYADIDFINKKFLPIIFMNLFN